MENDELQATMEDANDDNDADGAPKYTGVFGPSNVLELCIKITNHNHERCAECCCNFIIVEIIPPI